MTEDTATRNAWAETCEALEIDLHSLAERKFNDANARIEAKPGIKTHELYSLDEMRTVVQAVAVLKKHALLLMEAGMDESDPEMILRSMMTTEICQAMQDWTISLAEAKGLIAPVEDNDNE